MVKEKERCEHCVPFVAHEAEMARAERTTKRLLAIIVLLVVLLFGSNAAWLWYESQFETVETVTETYETTADGGGNAIINGGGSVRING